MIDIDGLTDIEKGQPYNLKLEDNIGTYLVYLTNRSRVRLHYVSLTFSFGLQVRDYIHLT